MDYHSYAGAYPSGADVHVNQPLSNFALQAFTTDDSQFIGEKLLPEIAVAKQTDRYYVINKDEFLKASGTGSLRAPKNKARRVEFTISSGSYFADNYALASEIAMEDLINADVAINLRQNAVKVVVQQLRLQEEVRISNLVTSISNVGSGVALTGANKWSDPASDPIGDVSTGQAFIRAQTGILPNTLVIDWDTLKVLRRHPLIVDMFKYSSGGSLTEDNVKAAFGVQNVLVGQGIKNQSAEGQANSIVPMWGNSAVLAYVGQSTGLESVTFGGRFRWRNPIYPGDFAVKTAMEAGAGQKNIELVETGYYQDEKIIAKELAYTITGTL